MLIKNQNKWHGGGKLKLINKEYLPSYISSNIEKFKFWLD